MLGNLHTGSAQATPMLGRAEVSGDVPVCCLALSNLLLSFSPAPFTGFTGSPASRAILAMQRNLYIYIYIFRLYFESIIQLQHVLLISQSHYGSRSCILAFNKNML